MKYGHEIPSQKLGCRVSKSPPSGLGCMECRTSTAPADEITSLSVLNAALDIVINFLDTADVYGGRRQRTACSKDFETRRQDVVSGHQVRNGVAATAHSLGITKTRVRAWSLRCRLKRLGVDHIDLYYSSSRRFRSLRSKRPSCAMVRTVKAGKVRHLGLSELRRKPSPREKVHPDRQLCIPSTRSDA